MKLFDPTFFDSKETFFVRLGVRQFRQVAKASSEIASESISSPQEAPVGSKQGIFHEMTLLVWDHFGICMVIWLILVDMICFKTKQKSGLTKSAFLFDVSFSWAFGFGKSDLRAQGHPWKAESRWV